MKNFKKHGTPPFTIAVIHGGPGAAGEMSSVAQEIAALNGVLEPFQTKLTIDEQVQELKQTLQDNAIPPVTLIGYSWGAFLSFIFAAENPSMVKKLILVSSGPFEAEYAKNIMPTRLSRMTQGEKAECESLFQQLKDPTNTNKSKTFGQLGTLIAKTDSFDPIEKTKSEITIRYDIYDAVWTEAAELRSSGKLLALGKDIQCPVAAIHGDYDPHPAAGVQKPLATGLKNFRFTLIKNCGHTPWIEKMAQEKFYEILKKELA